MLPLLKSKLMIPEIPSKALYSQRLKDLEIPGKRIVVVTAPAGFGKTLSVLLSLKYERNHVRWYRMENEDAHLPIFYMHLIETLFPDSGINSPECYRTLTSIQDIQNEYPLLNAQICQDLFAAADGNYGMNGLVYLVLDDFHTVLGNPAIIKTIQYFAVNLPPNLSIIVTSRTETGILSGRLAIHPDTKAIGPEDLRFSREDAEKLIRSSYKLSFSPEELDRIYTCSEGWAAGLYMICHSSRPLEICAFDAARPSQDSLNRFDMYFHEFLRDLDEDRRFPLMKVSILPDFSERELKEIFCFEQTGDLIEWLEKSSLYLQKVLSKPVRYRFHSLFRMQLQTALHDSFPEEQIQEMHRTAAGFYQKDGNHDKAIHILLQAGCIREAVMIAQTACIQAFDSGRIDLLPAIIGPFSDAIIRGNPYLLYSKGVSLVNINHEQCFEHAKTSLQMFKRINDLSYCMNSFGLILAVAFETSDFSYLESTAGDLPKLRIALAGGVPRKN